MTRPSDHPPPQRPEGSSATGDDCGALLRLAVTAGHWAERLPPVPSGTAVTVSLSSEAATHEHGETLRLLGYRVVAPSGTRTVGGDVADFLVPPRAAARHPTWWRALARQADHAFSLAFGPVQMMLGEALRPHRSVPGHQA